MHPRSETTHSRTQFQIDRIAFFSDAVIAIGMTLMILEVKIPVLGKDLSWGDFKKNYGSSLLTHAVALFIGFLTIGNLWIRHHQLFEHINNYSHRLVKINLYFLFSVMMLPIATSFFFTDNEPVHIKYLLFFIALFLSNLLYTAMLLIVFHKKNNFSSLQDRRRILQMKNESLAICAGYFVGDFLLFMQVKWFWFGFFIIPIYRRAVDVQRFIAERKKARVAESKKS